MKKIVYIIAFSFLGILVGFTVHALLEWPIIFLLTRNFAKYSLGFSWAQWFVIHNVGLVLLLFAGGLFGLSQGWFWWRIIYVEKRRFGHHPQAIVLDFDHTLFNTTLYVKALQEVFAQEFGITPSIFLQHRKAVKACCEVIDIDKFINRLPHPNKPAMHQALHQFIADRAAEFVFSDARYFIEHHSSKFDIILLTHGDQELQEEKIKHSNLPKITETIITRLSKEQAIGELLEDYRQLYFIDDKASTIDKVKMAYPELVAYFVVRPNDQPYAHPGPACECSDDTVTGLNFEIGS